MIQRYFICANRETGLVIQKTESSEYGKWVLYDDHQAELAKKEEELDELRKDRDLAFGRRDEYFKLLAKKDEEIARLIKCLYQANKNHEQFERNWYLGKDKVEQLQAELDQVVGEAVQVAEVAVSPYVAESTKMQAAEEFLTSPLVQSWRARQGKECGS